MAARWHTESLDIDITQLMYRAHSIYTNTKLMGLTFFIIIRTNGPILYPRANGFVGALEDSDRWAAVVADPLCDGGSNMLEVAVSMCLDPVHLDQ